MITVSIAFLVMLIGLILYLGASDTPPNASRRLEVYKWMFIVGLFWTLANVPAIAAFFNGK